MPSGPFQVIGIKEYNMDCNYWHRTVISSVSSDLLSAGQRLVIKVLLFWISCTHLYKPFSLTQRHQIRADIRCSFECFLCVTWCSEWSSEKRFNVSIVFRSLVALLIDSNQSYTSDHCYSNQNTVEHIAHCQQIRIVILCCPQHVQLYLWLLL